MATDYQQKAGQGSAFPKQKTKDTQPDFQGEIVTPSGEKLEVSIWKKPMRSGGEFLSFSIKPPFVPQPKQNEPPQGEDMPEDDVPDFLKGK